MNTAVNDRGDYHTNQPTLREDEWIWIQDKIGKAVFHQKKVVLFSHNLLFTYSDHLGLSPNKQYTPLNVSLYTQIKEVLPHISALY